MPRIHRLLPLLAWVAVLSAAESADEAIQPGLPPEARMLHLAPGAAAVHHPTIERGALGEDLQVLRRALERVETALRLGQQPKAAEHTEGAEPAHHPADHAVAPADEGPGQDVASDHFGADRLAGRRWAHGRCVVTAAISAEPAEVVIREISVLAGVRLDTGDIGGLRRPVSLHVRDLSWNEALDRTLGQVGLSWIEDGEANGVRRYAVVDDPAAAATRSSEQALTSAAAAGVGPVAAEAAWRLARRTFVEGHMAEAMRRYNDVVERYADDRDPIVRGWVQKAVRGVADCMLELKQLREARSVYRNYISRAEATDPALPEVYLRTAEVGRRLGLERNDPIAFDEAIEDLHTLLERFAAGEHGAGAVPPEVPQARLMIGGLLFDARRWHEAEVHLAKYHEAAGGRPVDQVEAWLAECALQLGRPDEALPRFERLHHAWRDGTADGLTDAGVYVAAANRTGLCHLRATPPRYVEALFSFQRAAHDFPKATMEPEVVVAMAACYAQIEQEENAVEALLGMLKADSGSDGKGGRLGLDAVVGDLMDRLAEHKGPVRARAYFYIAQATYRRAERERTERTSLAAQAVGYYDRVLADNPPADLRDAARLGLARAALLAGNDGRGLDLLRQVRTDPQTQPRDREFANRLLGEWLRSQGRHRDAIKAFRGETEGL